MRVIGNPSPSQPEEGHRPQRPVGRHQRWPSSRLAYIAGDMLTTDRCVQQPNRPRIVCSVPTNRTPVLERILRLCKPTRGGHLIWKGSTNNWGVPQIRAGGRDGKILAVARVLWEAKNGELEPRRRLQKTCEVLLCVSPEHRELGQTSVVDPAHRNRHQALARYGITPDDYDKMLAKQKGKCAACGSEDPKSRWGVFHVDHDHETGDVRGLLCSPCNCALGFLQDDPVKVKKLLAYIRKFS